MLIDIKSTPLRILGLASTSHTIRDVLQGLYAPFFNFNDKALWSAAAFWDLFSLQDVLLMELMVVEKLEGELQTQGRLDR